MYFLSFFQLILGSIGKMHLLHIHIQVLDSDMRIQFQIIFEQNKGTIEFKIFFWGDIRSKI